MHVEPGTRLGPYEILAPIGAGGMGVVYRARDERLGREVAVKVLAPDLGAGRDRLRRFESEARAVSALNHPSILTVHDVGSHDGSPYLVTELLEGETLRARLAGGPLPPRRAAEIAAAVARGLAAAHERGIVHRDLKPENLFLTRDGRAKILDFGIAKLVRPESTGNELATARTLAHTNPGMVLGTDGYMSPEQVRGLPADARSDLFALGAVLYEMLTGHRAFHGESPVETMHAILHDDPPELAASSRAVPPGLERTVRHCLEKSPDERFQEARDLAFALESLTSDSAGTATDGTVAFPTPAAPRRAPRARPRALAAGGAAALLVAALLAGAWALGSRRTAGPPQLFTLRPITFSGRDRAPAASPDGRTVAFVSERDGRARIWLKQLATGSEAALTAGGDDAPRFSPDGATILFARTDGGRTDLYRVSILGGEERRLVANAASGDFSPDGRRLVFVRNIGEPPQSGTAVYLANADGSGARELARLAQDPVANPRFSPDGRLVALTGSFSTGARTQPIYLVRTDGSGFSRLEPPPPWPIGRLSSVVWVGAEELVYSQPESVAGDISGSSARIVRQNLRTGRAWPLEWTPQNSLVLDLLGSGRLVLDARSPRENLREIPLDPAAGPGRWLTQGNSTDRQPAYDPDGDWVAFSSTRNGNFDLWMVSTRTGAVRQLTDDAAADWDPAFTPDGRHLLWSSDRGGHFEIWMAERDGSGARQVSRDGVDAENPTMTADGRWIVYASGKAGSEGVWKVRPDGSRTTRIRAGCNGIPEVSPDGRYVLCGHGVDLFRTDLVVSRVADGAPVPFTIRVTGTVRGAPVLGRARWLPDGKAIAFVGQDERGVFGVFAQDFVPGRDTSATRRLLGGLEPEATTESFGISPDGRRLTVAILERLSSVMVADGLPDVARPQRP
ncbi:MAG TPA: protein kinase [Thermoanaerobaculia bacterium]|nr:protein kinase [Thermoanaerobaculia bacterium]